MMEVLPEKIHDKMQVLFDKRDEENGSASVLLIKQILVDCSQEMRRMRTAFEGAVETARVPTPSPTSPSTTTPGVSSIS